MNTYRQHLAIGAKVSALQVQAIPDPQALAALIAAQDACRASIEGWWRVPAASLHLTVQPIIDPGEPANARDVLSDPMPHWCDELAQICRLTQPFVVRLDRVACLGNAIIAHGEQPHPLAVLRSQLADALAEKVRPVRRLDIAHVTLFRRTGQCDQPNFPPILHECTMIIGHLRMVKERIYPSLDVKVLSTFTLDGV